MPGVKSVASYISGCVRRKSLGITISHPDGLSDPTSAGSYIFIIRPQFYGMIEGCEKTHFMAISVADCTVPITQFCIMASDGRVFLLGKEGKSREEVTHTRAPLRRIRAVAGRALAVGMMRQVFRRVDFNSWVRLDTHDMEKAKVVVGFETIDGYSDSDIYCAGWEGEIWHYDGKKWRQLDSPTNLILFDCCCAPDGKVYICGQMGIILKGRDDAWEVIDHGGPKVNWWNCCWYQDKLWLACDRGLYTLGADGKLSRVDFNDDEPETFRHLSAADGVLLSTGPKDVMLFDGNAWTRID